MKLSRRVWRERMRLISVSESSSVVWMRYKAAQEALLTQLANDRRRLRETEEGKPLSKNATRAAAEITGKMARIHRDIIEVGQSMGVYEQAPQEVNVHQDDPTMGMFYEPMEDATGTASVDADNSETRH